VKFDQFQLQAVETKADRALVLAVPGSGKTCTIVGRIHHLIDSGVSPSSIVCITFTRMAANELRSRVGDKGRNVYIGTFHAFCLRLLMTMGSELDYDPSWLTIVDDDEAWLDQLQVLEDLAVIRPRGAGGYKWDGVTRKQWESFVQGVESGERVDRSIIADEPLWRAWDAYTDRLRHQNVLTFGTILTEALRLLHGRAALDYFRSQYRHFLVDESQDTSSVQWSIVWRFIELTNPATVFSVGDEDQSIYRWRGAAPDLLLKFAKDPRTSTVVLENTYRYGEAIRDVSTSLIAHNSCRTFKNVQCVRHGGDVTYHAKASQDAIVATIGKEAASGRNPGDVVVIARTHRVLAELSAVLKERGVPHVKIGEAASIRASSEFRSVMGYVRLLVNPYDRNAFMAIAATEGIGNDRLLEIRAAAVDVGISLLAASGLEMPADVMGIGDHVRSVHPDHDYQPALDYLAEVVHVHGLQDPVALVNWVMLSDIQDEVATARDTLMLCTVHAAKGLEWPVVLVVGLDDGVFPSRQSVSAGMLEEERNLLYVAMTRARDRLHLFSSEGCVPSRFLAECGVMRLPEGVQ